MRSFWAAVLAYILLIGCDEATEAHHDATIALAKELDERGDYAGAILIDDQIINDARTDESELAEAFYHRAEMKLTLAMGNLEGDEAFVAALKDYTRAIELAPGNQSYRRSRGSAFQHLGGYEEAFADFEELGRLEAEIGPMFWSLIRKGALKRIQGEYDAAIRLFDEAKQNLEPQPSMPANYHKALVFLKMRRYAQAIEAINFGLDAQKDYGSAFLMRSCAKAGLGQFKEALADYRHGLELDSKYAISTQVRSHKIGARHNAEMLSYLSALAAGRIEPDVERIDEICFGSWYFQNFERLRGRSPLLHQIGPAT